MTTTDASVDLTMETDGIIVEEKTIDMLLSSNTYQGMTDDEIDRIIEYKINHAVNVAISEALIEQLQTERDARIELLQQHQNETAELFNKLIKRKTSFITVDPETGLAVTND